MEQGKFIVIEGTEYTGKTTQSEMLRDRCEKSGVPVYATMECSQGPVGKVIRNEYLSGRRQADRKLINFLYAADRIDHITNTVDGMLNYIKNGVNVISDRYYMTSLALYPLEWWGTDEYKKQMEFIMQCNQTAYELMEPDLTIVLDVPADELVRRAGTRPDKVEIYDAPEIVRRSITSYNDAIAMLEARGENIVRIDAVGTNEEVHERVWDIARRILCL